MVWNNSKALEIYLKSNINLVISTINVTKSMVKEQKYLFFLFE